MQAEDTGACFEFELAVKVVARCAGTLSPSSRNDGRVTWLQFDPDVAQRAGIKFPQLRVFSVGEALNTVWYIRKNDLHSIDADGVLTPARPTGLDYTHCHIAYDDGAMPDIPKRSKTEGDPLRDAILLLAGSADVVFHPLSRQLTLTYPVLPIA